MNFVFSIIVFLLIFGISIFIHEAGHFYFAKKAGVLCHEFSFGMGKAIYQKKKGETTYSIRAIPIGGYVAMAGEDADSTLLKKDTKVKLLLENNVVTKIILRDSKGKYNHLNSYVVVNADLYGKNKDLELTVSNEEGEIETFKCLRNGFYVDNDRELQFSPYDRCLESKSFWQRFLAIFAGPFTNFVLAIFLFFIIGLLVGKDNVESNKMGIIPEGYPAYVAGIRPGDNITMVNGNVVNSFSDISEILNGMNIADGISIVYERDGVQNETFIKPINYYYSIGFRSDNTKDGLIITGVSGTIAEKQGFIDQDEIISIDGIKVENWSEVSDIMNSNISGRVMTFVVLRNGEEKTIYADPYSDEILKNQGVSISDSVIGINPTRDFSLTYALKYSVTGLYNSMMQIFDTLRLLFVSDEVGVSDLSGPVGIFTMTSSFVKQGLVATLTWFGLLSVNIGIINLLPVPALDGGRIVFLIIEKLSGKSVNRKIEALINNFFFFLLMLLMLFVTFNDVLRLF